MVIESVYNPHVPKLQRRTLAIIFSAGGGSIFTFLSTLLFVSIHRIMGPSYSPLYGYIFLQIITNGLMMLMVELFDMLEDRPNKHLVQLLMLPLQFFLELAVSIVFVDANPLTSPVQFSILLLLVVLVDLATETGALHENYYKAIKKDQSKRGRAIYLAKKHQLIKQKMFAEPLATFSILLMTFTEYFSQGKISLFGHRSGSRAGIMIGYGILIGVELVLGRIGTHQLSIRMGRMREKVSTELTRIEMMSRNHLSITISRQDRAGKAGEVIGDKSSLPDYPISPSVTSINRSSAFSKFFTSGEVNMRSDMKSETVKLEHQKTETKQCSSGTVEMNSISRVPEYPPNKSISTASGIPPSEIGVNKDFIEMYPILKSNPSSRREGTIFEKGSVYHIFIIVSAGSTIFPTLFIASELGS
mmetsp:Transcript_16926/g.25409  ORF Transcript_16926/g.25409 Transcript_16926/m.25409 type:complete len:416 (+) Transcript_16926:1-1248(+)